MNGIGVLAAFAGGLLSLVSPCAALLLPSFFAYAFGRVGTLVARTGAFLAGLLAVMIPLGAGVGLVGELLTRYRGTVTAVGAVVLIALGVLTLLGRGVGSAAAGRLAGRRRLGSAGSVFLLGTVYGLAGFCSGPLLGSVLTVAAMGADPLYGAVLMAVYAAGMALPLFVLALFWDRMGPSTRRMLRGRELRLGPITVHSTNFVSGLLFVAIGTLFLLTDGTANLGGLSAVDTQFALQSWVAEATAHVPDLAVVLAVILVLLAVATIRLLRTRTSDDPAPDDPASDDPASEPPPPSTPRKGTRRHERRHDRAGRRRPSADRRPAADRHP